LGGGKTVKVGEILGIFLKNWEKLAGKQENVLKV